MSFRHHFAAIALIILATSTSVFAGSLAWPVECIPGISCLGDTFYLGYPDADGKGHSFDCGKAGYAGHNGTDIIVSSLDARVPVLSAADGEVIWVSEGASDGCPAYDGPGCTTAPAVSPVRGGEPVGKVCDPLSGCFSWGFDAGNFVLVKHGGTPGLVTLYAHLRQGSLAVVTGQRVHQGEKLAEVGSSGNALTPHLHFGVFYASEKGNRLADPWHGNCSKGSASLWRYDPPYRADIMVSKGGDGTGLVTSSLTEISCGSRCAVTVSPGTLVTLRAVPYDGSEFTGWAGEGCVGQGSVCRTTAVATTLVTALFKSLSPSPDVQPLLAAIGLQHPTSQQSPKKLF